MRFIPTAASRRAKQAVAGFTLIEMLIIAPLVIIMVSGFIALMVAMVGDVLQARDQNVIVYDAQNALDRIEQDVHISSKLLVTSNSLTAPQGSDSNFTGTAAFTNTSNTLIFSEPAADQNANSATRNLIYYAYQPNPCGASETFNTVFTYRVVYFIKDGSLWRRTVVPDYNTLSTPNANTICNDISASRPWAQNSCSPGYPPVGTRCETNDEEVMKNVDSISAKYYSNPGDTTDIGAVNALQASTVEVTINGKKTTAGRTFTTSDTLRASKANSLDTDVYAPDAPVVTHAYTQPDKVAFSWAAVPNTVTYNVSYNINGGSWINTTLPSSTTSYTVDAVRGDTISIKVAAASTTQTSADGTDTASINLWNDLSLKASWTNYNSATYDTAQFTKAPDGTVFVKGTVKGGTVTNGTVLATLPVGYRPSAKLVMAASTSSNVFGRVEIDINGDIIINVADNTYLSLDNIAFLPSTSTYTWNAPTLSNGWTNYANGYEAVHETKDNIGRVHVQGLAKPGTTTAGTVIAQPIDSSYAPTKTYHFSAGSTIYSEFWMAPDGSLVKRGSQSPVSMGVQTIYYPGALGTWTDLTLLHSWVNFGGAYSNLQYTKATDKIVTVRGVVKSGTTTADTVIAQLPPGARPITRQVFSIASNDVYGRADVDSDGNIMIRSGSNVFFAINISFVVN